MKTAHLIFFSPTGTTRQVCTSIGRGLKADRTLCHDLTLPGRGLCEDPLTDGIAVIGVPVYAGRVPQLCLQRMQSIRAEGVPAILVALYGNREFEDALLELRDTVTRSGFVVVSAAAFIGEHSYATTDFPIASGRPDKADLQKAFDFGRESARKIEQGVLTLPGIPGDLPYKERVPLGGVAPETDRGRCSLCGACQKVCPAGVVTVAQSVSTEADGCIMCCACVKQCPTGARVFDNPLVQQRREMLLRNCSTPKAPSLFF